MAFLLAFSCWLISWDHLDRELLEDALSNRHASTESYSLFLVQLEDFTSLVVGHLDGDVIGAVLGVQLLAHTIVVPAGHVVHHLIGGFQRNGFLWFSSTIHLLGIGHCSFLKGNGW